MIIGVIVLILAVVLGYIFFSVKKELQENYYRKDIKIYPGWILFFLPLFIPKDYFIKEKMFQAYLLYLFSIICGVLFVYLLYVLIKGGLF